MIWLDGILAVPTIGIRILPKPLELEKLEKSVYYFLDYLQTKKKLDWAITLEKPWSYLIFPRSVGFSFKISSEDFVVTFVYQIASKEQAGRFPSPVIPDPRTYTELLNEALEYLKVILSLTNNIKEFKFNRIGVVANSILNKESIPPGLGKWISHLGKPWDDRLRSAQSVLLAKLHEEEGHYDQCHHTLKFNEEAPEAGFQFTLDWQRIFKEPITLDERDTFEKVKICKDEAIGYFKRFGEGGLNYG